MSIAHHRKKQPDIVRKQLLDMAAKVAIEHGIGNLTLGAVAREAGVSKGGLLHHFPSKLALLEALCDQFLHHLDAHIAASMAQDPVAKGHFARAYLDAMSSRDWMDGSERWAVLSVMLFSKPALRKRWHDWVERRLEQNAQTDDSPSAWIVRLAADGLWLSDIVDGEQANPQRRQAVIEELKSLTYQES